MNRLKTAIIRAISFSYINIKKHYRFYRIILNAFNWLFFQPAYNSFDQKIMVEDREIPVRVFRPQKNGCFKTLIFFHGGGWVTGNIDSYTRICSNMAEQTKHTVISVDYRLAPEHPFPAGIEDCYYATKEIFANIDLLHCNQRDITLIGDSAGGNLAAVVSLMAKNRGEFMPCKQILIYPATYNDYSEKSPFPSIKEYGAGSILTSKRIREYMDLYVQNENDKANPYVAPILADDLFNQPQTLIITAEYDPLRDEGEAYGMKLKQFANDVRIYRMNKTYHGFFTLPNKSASVVRCYEIINAFLKYNEKPQEG